MLVTFTCPHCAKQMEGERQSETNTANCPECGEPVVLPLGVTVGCTLGNGYRLEKKLEESATGENFLATQMAMHREVMVKILSPALVSDREGFGRFIREAKLSGGLNHANILSALDAGEDCGVHFLVTEYRAGIKLTDYLMAHGNRLAEKDAAKLLSQIASALDHAWQEKTMLHRNVKPENILVSAEGQTFLLNLGIAKSLQDDQMNLTGVGFTVGTPDYMSPEQIQASEGIDFRADMYSLGVVLYQCVTGELPFSDPNPVALMNKHLEEAHVPACEKNAQVSAGCSKLIDHLLSKSPADRPSCWQELIDELNEISRPSKAKGKKQIAALKSAQQATRAALQAKANAKPLEVETGSSLKGKYILLSCILVICIILAVAVFNPSPPPQAGTPTALHGTALPELVPDGLTAVSKSETSPALTEPQVPVHSARIRKALAFYETHPDDYEGTIDRFLSIMENAQGTPDSSVAEKMIEQINADRAARIDRLLNDLDNQANKLLAQGKRDEALSLIRNYEGPLAEESTTERWQLAGKLPAKAPQPKAGTPVADQPDAGGPEARLPDKTPETEQRLGKSFNQLMATLKDGKMHDALAISRKLAAMPKMLQQEPRLKALTEVIQGVADKNQTILRAATQLVGKTVKLRTKDLGTIQVRIQAVSAQQITAQQLIIENGKTKGNVLVYLSPSQIHPRDQVGLIKQSELPHHEAICALLAYRAGQKKYAFSLLSGSQDTVSKLLLVGLK